VPITRLFACPPTAHRPLINASLCSGAWLTGHGFRVRGASGFQDSVLVSAHHSSFITHHWPHFAVSITVSIAASGCRFSLPFGPAKSHMVKYGLFRFDLRSWRFGLCWPLTNDHWPLSTANPLPFGSVKSVHGKILIVAIFELMQDLWKKNNWLIIVCSPCCYSTVRKSKFATK